MDWDISGGRLQFLVNRIGEHLWVKPLAACALSVVGVFVAQLTDGSALGELLPVITPESVDTLLSIMASSMLVIATFAVASMVSAYASASTTATPRALGLVLADDVSQNALSTFIGAFIFSIVGLTVQKNGMYESAGRFTLFVITVCMFAAVIFTFVRWVDRIARLGRLGPTIEMVEEATAAAFSRRIDARRLGGAALDDAQPEGRPVYSQSVGYLQHVDMATLQACAEEHDTWVRVCTLPGDFVAPGVPLAFVGGGDDVDNASLWDAFLIGSERHFDNDPRFGLVVLSEIAGRALSPAVNDPGTAIDIVGRLVRLFVPWAKAQGGDAPEVRYTRVFVPELSVSHMFDDAFTSIARDGAGAVEVAVRLQRGLASLSTLGDAELEEAAKAQAQTALARAEATMVLSRDVDVVRESCAWAETSR